MEVSSREEPRAWARKYLTPASVSFFVWERSIRGIKERRFSSSMVHIVIGLLVERSVTVLVESVVVKRRVWGRDFIIV